MIESRPLSTLQSQRKRLRQSFQGQSLATLFSARLSLSIGAQALVSGFHFLLNLWLVRELSLHDYGIFAFAFVLVMFGNAINNALISTPLTVYTPVINDPAEREKQEIMLGTANVFLVALVFLCGLVYCTTNDMIVLNVIGVGLFVAVNCARQFSRSTGYARLRPLVTATGEAAYVLVGTVLVLLVLWQSETLVVGNILLALVAAQCIAILVERLRLLGHLRLRFKPSLLTGYGHYWEQSRWGLIGALTTLFMGQAHSVIVTTSLGPATFAPLAAGFVLFGPVRVALMTWQNLVKPEIAVALSEQRFEQVRHQIHRTAALAAGAAVVLAIGLALLWPIIHEVLYAARYADQPMAKIVAFWALITLFAAMYNAPSAALQALRDFKILAWASIYGAIISLVLVLLILKYGTPSDTLFGILCAELFTLVFLSRVLASRLQTAS
ncbi:MAG: hypothetical protein KTR33_11070 [Gammaproteobacteria bacterium]|nr:hypothetical protein [Gammaproteobacteria bacterium]